MTVKTTPQKFRASDGTEFTSRKAAEKYDKKLLALRAFEDAKKHLQLAIAESSLTADGQIFTFERWSYWWVTPGHFTMPNIRRVMVNRWDVSLRDDCTVEIVEHIDSSETVRSDRRPMTWKISDLYAAEDAAKVALKAACKEWLAEQKKRVEGMA